MDLIFHHTIDSTLGFRECLILMKIAQKNDCLIELIGNGKKGNTNSIISLIQLGIKQNDLAILIVKGENRQHQITCVKQIEKLFKCGWQKEDLELYNDSKSF